ILVFISFARNSSLRRPRYFLYINLCAADLAIATLVYPLETVYLGYFPYWPLGRLSCKLWQLLFVVTGTTQVYTIAAASLEKYLAIKDALRHEAFYTANKAITVVVSTWILGLITGGVFYYFSVIPEEKKCTQLKVSSGIYGLLSLLLCLIIPLLLLIYSYLSLFFVARKHSRRIRADIANISRSSQENPESNNICSLNGKARKTVTLLVGTFAVCMIPFLVFQIYDTFTMSPTNHQWFSITKWVSHINSAVNWAIY
ncbi:predicted protein, partial [Nematostella vectensis]